MSKKKNMLPKLEQNVLHGLEDAKKPLVLLVKMLSQFPADGRTAKTTSGRAIALQSQGITKFNPISTVSSLRMVKSWSIFVTSVIVKVGVCWFAVWMFESTLFEFPDTTAIKSLQKHPHHLKIFQVVPPVVPQSWEANPKAQAHPSGPQSAQATILSQVVRHEGLHCGPGGAASNTCIGSTSEIWIHLISSKPWRQTRITVRRWRS